MVSVEEIQVIFGQFKEAKQRLTEALALKDENGIKQDAVIKRFEFTYELLWKTYKKIARAKEFESFTPKDCFKFAFKSGLIDDEKIFLEIIDARNKTAHVYSKEEAEEIYNFIKSKVLVAFNKAEEKLKKFKF